MTHVSLLLQKIDPVLFYWNIGVLHLRCYEIMGKIVAIIYELHQDNRPSWFKPLSSDSCISWTMLFSCECISFSDSSNLNCCNCYNWVSYMHPFQTCCNVRFVFWLFLRIMLRNVKDSQIQLLLNNSCRYNLQSEQFDAN